ncbi:hypothetical protein FKW77_009921 [Venturia effusa]|uniref:DUF803-domain-containing protein n=1 Tax=Venturia effusa TaxID=50376 RepID=A0A517L881_9PEZI|nr:hypothetical protein FKW77_009921 [Venturia effusa]
MDAVGGTLLVANQLYARANTTETAKNDKEKPASYKIIGLVLAIASGLFIGVSFVLKKHGLLKANIKYNEEAGEGYGYLKNVWWWTGMILMVLGEICNFAAYLFADAILVTPLGALSVVICAILSSIFLKERLSFVGKIGCLQCIVGSVVIAANAPEQGAVNTIQDMQKLVISPGFLSYAGVIILACAFIALWLGPRYGKKTMMVYITVCSLIGGLSVVSIQGIGAAITAQARGTDGPQFKNWFIYVLIVFIIATLVTEIIFLNKALNLYNAALVTPTYYVYFTSATIVSSAVLFRGFKGTPIQILTVVLGFLQICTGVILLQLSKSAKDVPDAAVFKGDLDQVRTVAEQEEPEYEPRADTMRGAGAIIRSISKARQSRQLEEAKRLQEEHRESMTPIGENEHIEFDGIRRRRTIIGQQGTRGSIRAIGGSPLNPENRPSSTSTYNGSVVRRKTLHPPLGMSHFPEDDEQEEDLHPGFLDRFRRKNHSSKTLPPIPGQDDVPMSPVKTEASTVVSRDSRGTPREHIYGLTEGLKHEDTSYHPQTDGSHIHFQEPERPSSNPTGLLSPPPPTPPPHSSSGGTRRQFSFQNPFHKRAPSGEASSGRPVSRSSHNFTGRNKSNTITSNDGITEEERLGLVHGDSNNTINLARTESPPQYSDPEEEWQITGDSPPRHQLGTYLDVTQTRLPRYASGPNDPASPALLSGPGRERADSDGSLESNPAAARRPGDARDRQAFI